MKLRFLLFALLCLMATGCSKPDTAAWRITGDYFIYGRAGGFTTPDYHTTYFLVNNRQLRKDVTQLAQGPAAGIEGFNFSIICPPTQYNSVADLPGTIPAALLAHTDSIVGASLPDAGYTDIRARIDGISYKWRFEANLDSVAAPIREFYNRCNISFR